MCSIARNFLECSLSVPFFPDMIAVGAKNDSEHGRAAVKRGSLRNDDGDGYENVT